MLYFFKLSTFLLLSSRFYLASSSLPDKLEAEEKRGSLQQEAESLKVIDFHDFMHLISYCLISIQNFLAESKKVKGRLGMEGVGGMGLGRWARIYSEKQFGISVSVCTSCWLAKLVIRYPLIHFCWHFVPKMIIFERLEDQSLRSTSDFILVDVCWHRQISTTFPGRAANHMCLGNIIPSSNVKKIMA